MRPRGASAGSNSLSTSLSIPLEYVAFIAWCFLVALAGGLVGLVLGNIRLPATVLLASSPAAGAGANLAISAAAAGTAALAHLRAGRVNWRLFAWMAPPSVAGALAGGYVSGILPRGLLLGTIAAVLLYSGLDLMRWTPPERSARAPDAEEVALDVRAAVISGALIGLLGGSSASSWAPCACRRSCASWARRPVARWGRTSQSG